ncbi:hypothetical protein CR194_05580 [Salipaludibacillus keqinensis]|uniref:Uncharacterized protein n=1 Tax=Salipaludibacillus keqinensis TaxID=2045207 RepID=A0A323TMU7_9BACI|nr:hypothetical protein [Salipaludibacillus keqinensis]PYZ94987.1 hypothetical protein CR194_05580 [Salipaludibacillus keqinensis]
MSDKKDHIKKNIKAELGGMSLYGTTSNMEVEGYEMSGDIENAGQLDKGFKRNKEHDGEVADFIVDELPKEKNKDGGYVLDHVDDEDTESQTREDNINH